MPCPTCGHTLAQLCDDGDRTFWHCPRCGTASCVYRDGSMTLLYVPSLVRCCREFADTLGPRWGELWQRLGIEESIHQPKDRNTPENRSQP